MPIKNKISRVLREWIPFFDVLKEVGLEIFDFVIENFIKIFLVVAILCASYVSLCVSDMLFLKMLGYGWGAEWDGWRFISYASQAFASVEKKQWIFSLLIPFFLVLLGVAALFSDKQNSLFGKAHWANLFEAKKSGVLSKTGILLGKKWGQYLRVGGFEHVFVFAPSGSGKTTSLVMPNLLTWNDSCIVQDVKGGIFKETSAFRAKYGHACYLWNPGTRDSHTHAYNPIDSVSKDPLLRIDDLQKIAGILIPDPVSSENAFFASTARQLFLGLMLYLLDTEQRPKTLGEMTRLAKNSANFPEWVVQTLKERTDLDPLCYRNLLSFVNNDYRTQANILQSFLSYFELFDNPLLDAATSRSDFDIRQLREKRMTIYVAAGSDNLSRLSPLLTVFYQQVMDSLLRNVPDLTKEPYGLLMMLDEFSALKRMEVLQKSMGLMREYRIRVMAIIQDLPQLYVTYGHDGAKAFINSKYRVAYAQNDLDAANLISGWLGSKTVEQRSQQSKHSFFESSESKSMTKIPLMTADAILKLNHKKMILAIEGNPPILCEKVFWYKDSNFKKVSMGSIALPFLAPVLSPFDHGEMLSALAKKEAEKKGAQGFKKVSKDLNEEETL
jgi:type IV secretion system protein VirD4